MRLVLLTLLAASTNALLTVPIRKLSRGQKNDQSTPLKDYSDSMYVGSISLGTPAQNFNVIFSTMNSDFWITDSSCSDQQCDGYPEAGYTKNKYDSSLSSSYTGTSDSFTIAVGSAACKGPIYLEDLSIGGYSILNQTFGAASHIPEIFGYLPYDGCVGLGLSPSSSDTNKIVPIVQNILSQLPEQIITFWLDRHIKPSAGTAGGLITFGAADQSNCDADILYVPLTSKDFWQFKLDKFQFGSFVSQKSMQAISDTATDFLGLPTTAIANVMKTLHADFDSNYELYTVSCDVMKSAPKMLFTIGGTELFVDNFEYILNYGLDDGKCAVAAFDMGDTSFTVDYLLSEPFVRAYCNVYSIADQRIGFARAKHYNV